MASNAILPEQISKAKRYAEGLGNKVNEQLNVISMLASQGLMKGPYTSWEMQTWKKGHSWAEVALSAQLARSHNLD